MNTNRSGSRTLLTSVLMSAPGPIILAFGLLEGRSATQIADLLRRSSELLALICAYIVFRMTSHSDAPLHKARLERSSNLFVGGMMCLSGLMMILLALFGGGSMEGSVVTSLIIALLGLIANTLFWRKYTRLNQQEPNGIIAVQARLYRAKALVDGCVTLALAAVTFFPDSPAAAGLDTIGSVVVAAYLFWCGMKTIQECAAQ